MCSFWVLSFIEAWSTYIMISLQWKWAVLIRKETHIPHWPSDASPTWKLYSLKNTLYDRQIFLQWALIKASLHFWIITNNNLFIDARNMTPKTLNNDSSIINDWSIIIILIKMLILLHSFYHFASYKDFGFDWYFLLLNFRKLLGIRYLLFLL